MSPHRLKRRRLTLTKNGKEAIFSSLLRRNFATAKFGFIWLKIMNGLKLFKRTIFLSLKSHFYLMINKVLLYL
jgi:hypothetical protein